MSSKRRLPDDSLLHSSAPQLSDYYIPGEDQRICEYIFVAGSAIAGDVIGYWYYRQ